MILIFCDNSPIFYGTEELNLLAVSNVYICKEDRDYVYKNSVFVYRFPFLLKQTQKAMII